MSLTRKTPTPKRKTPTSTRKQPRRKPPPPPTPTRKTPRRKPPPPPPPPTPPKNDNNSPTREFLKYITTLKLDPKSHITQRIIKTQYRKLSLKHHPNKGGNTEDFKAIASAYEYLKELTPRQLDNFLKATKELLKANEEELLKAYKLFGILDEDNTVENIRKYYTRRNGNANKNILKLNSFDINEIMMTMFKVVLEHKGEEKYRYAMKLIEQDLEITKEERNLAYGEVMKEIKERPKGGAKDKNPVNGGAKRKTHKRKSRKTRK